MSAIDKIKEHFNSLDKGESKHFEEWDLTIYKEPLTLEKKDKIQGYESDRDINRPWL